MKRKGITGGTEGCQKLIKLLPKLDIDKLFHTYSKFKIYTTLCTRIPIHNDDPVNRTMDRPLTTSFGRSWFTMLYRPWRPLVVCLHKNHEDISG